MEVTANKRLIAVAGLLALSGVYAIVVIQDSALASALALGYVGFLLTVLLIISCWKKP